MNSGDTLFALASVVLFTCGGALYFFAVRPDLLNVYVAVAALALIAGAILIHWLLDRSKSVDA